MRNQSEWQPGKFEIRRGKLRASRNPNEVQIGSRLMGDLIAMAYQESLKNHARGKLIDLGSGNIPLYQAYRQYIKDVLCSDRDLSDRRNLHLDLACDLRHPLPIRNSEFDTLVLSDVLEHIPNPELLWNEMSRILSPGGTIILSTPFLYALHEQPEDYFRYSRYALERFVSRSGFKIIELRPLGGSLEVLTDFIAKHIQMIPIFGRVAAICIQDIVYRFSRTRTGKRLIEITSEFFPLGYFVVAENSP